MVAELLIFCEPLKLFEPVVAKLPVLILLPLIVVNDNTLLPFVVKTCPFVPSVVGYVNPCRVTLEPFIVTPLKNPSITTPEPDIVTSVFSDFNRTSLVPIILAFAEPLISISCPA